MSEEKMQLLEALIDQFDNLQDMYEKNLSRMGELQEQIANIKEANQGIQGKMKTIMTKMKEVKGN